MSIRFDTKNFRDFIKRDHFDVEFDLQSDDQTEDRIDDYFDPLSYKYGCRIQSEVETKKDWDKFHLTDDDRDEILSYERDKRPTNIDPHDTASMIMNTKLVYGSLEKAMEFQDLYETVAEKFIVDYIGIPGLSALYDEDYPDFEWSMHVNLNFKEHRNSYYRDHFIHEMRNVYMMYSLLNNKYIYHNVMKYLFNPSVGKLSEYIHSERRKWKYQFMQYPSHVQKVINDNFSAERDHLPEAEPADCYFMRYITYAASAIAGLFHDIGYPIAHCYETQDRAIEFFPPLNVLLDNESVTFSQLQDLLSDTLLFQIVDPKEIKERFEGRDHGTLSALLLALHYHKTGRIHVLPIEQQVALEYGIVIIYNHTLDFYYSRRKKPTLHYKMQFSRDPLSWLFRLCDDAQEWDREYFEITNTPNLMFCEKCHTPFLKGFDETNYMRTSDMIVRAYLDIPELSNNAQSGQENDPPLKNADEHANKPILTKSVKRVKYTCRCGNGKYIHDRLSWFDRRQIVTIQACDHVDVVTAQTGAGLAAGKLLFDFYYNPYKQLQICSIHHTFSQYRAKDLANDKRFLQIQDFTDELGQGYGDLGLRHNLTPNPYLLKAMIWGEYLEFSEYQFDHQKPNDEERVKALKGKLEKAKDETERNQMLEEWFADEFKERGPAIERLTSQIESIVVKLYGASTSDYVTNIIANAIFYSVIHYYWQMEDSLFRCIAIKVANQASDKYLEDSKSRGNIHNYKVRYFNDILEDAAQKQITNKVDPINYDDLYSANYEDYLLEGDDIYTAIGRYCDREEPINQVFHSKFYRDYFSDLYLYEQLSLFTKMKEKIV